MLRLGLLFKGKPSKLIPSQMIEKPLHSLFDVPGPRSEDWNISFPTAQSFGSLKGHRTWQIEHFENIYVSIRHGHMHEVHFGCTRRSAFETDGFR